MDIKRVFAVYFSPTKTTKTVCEAMASAVSEGFETIDFTSPAARNKSYDFKEGDLVFFGVPTYASRVPNKIAPFISEGFNGNGAAAVCFASFGGRGYEDAVSDIRLLLTGCGFKVAAAAGICCRHSFSDKLSFGRPNESDISGIKAFAKKASDKVKAGQLSVSVPGANPPEKYYVPKGLDGNPVNFLKAKPKTDPDKCVMCGRCAAVCPMGSIDKENTFSITGICIKCQACIRSCPAGAKYFSDEGFLSHVAMLEQNYAGEKKSDFFL